MNDEQKRNFILQHYYKPYHRGLIADNCYYKVNVNNEACLDNIDLMGKIEQGIIKDLRFDGEACAITISATSIMIKMVMGKTVETALNIYKEYENMIKGEAYNDELVGISIVYNNIYQQPNRKTCALLPWLGLKQIIEKSKK